MAVTAMALAALVAAAPGDMYRCVDGEGGLIYQDQPCRSGAQSVLRGHQTRQGRVPPAERRLREWLSRQSAVKREAQASSRAGPLPVRSPQRLSPPPPADERLLAVCSDQFLQCARDPARLDDCVAVIPACGGTARSCCHRAYVDRYQKLRAAGAGQPHAIREALLGR